MCIRLVFGDSDVEENYVGEEIDCGEVFVYVELVLFFEEYCEV